MKRTQRKDAVRNIKKQLVSFISIAIVIALGVAIFLSCMSSARALADSVDKYYDEMNYSDMEIISAEGLTEDDLEAVKNTEGIKDAEGFFTMSMLISNGFSFWRTQVNSKTDRINHVTVESGRLPEADDECAIVPEISSELNLGVGQSITIKPLSENQEFLKHSEFTITGIIKHPDNYKVSDISTASVLILPEAVDTEKLTVPYTGILIKTDTDSLDTFSNEYEKRIADIRNLLAPINTEHAGQRHDEIVSNAIEQINEGEQQLEENKQQVEENKQELKEKESKLEEGKHQIEEGEKELESASKQADASEKELAEGKEKLDASSAQLDEAEAQLAEARQTLDNAKAELDNAKAELDNAKTELDAGKAELDENEELLQNGRDELLKARAELDVFEDELEAPVSLLNNKISENWREEWGPVRQISSISELSDGYTLPLDDVLNNMASHLGISKEMLISLIGSDTYNTVASIYEYLPEGEANYEAGLAEYEAGLAEWNAGKAEYDASYAEYEAGLQYYNESLTEYQLGEAEYSQKYELYAANVAEYNSAVEQYNSGEAELESAKEEISKGESELDEKKHEAEEGESKLAEGESAIADAEEKIEQGEAELNNSIDQMNELRGGSWVITSRKTNPAWAEIMNIHRTFSQIGLTFSLMFVILGILVCYSTINRLINEQSQLVGTTKALGFTTREILMKYMVFGLGSSITGAIAGWLISFFVIQPLMLASTSDSLLIGNIPAKPMILVSVIALLISMLIAGLAVWAACSKLLKRPASKLLSSGLSDSFLKARKRAKPGNKSLYASILKRNIFSDLPRVIITIASIAGCCILLVIGFSMKQSYVELTKRQFSDILKFDMLVYTISDDLDTSLDLYDSLKKEDVSLASVYNFNTIVQVADTTESVQVVCADPEQLLAYVRLTDRNTGHKFLLPERGVAISSTLAETYNLTEGDVLQILDDSGVPIEVTVISIYQNYAGRFLFMPIEYAENKMHRTLANNAYLVSGEEATIANLEEKLLTQNKYVNYLSVDEMRRVYMEASGIMDFVILICIIMAIIMAAVVLFNLIKIQMLQKKREMTIMRVNGFSTRQTVMYILRENILTTIAGIILGLILGVIATRITLHTIDSVDLQMIRNIMVQPLIYAALISLFFSAVVNWLVLRKIKNLNLGDVNK